MRSGGTAWTVLTAGLALAATALAAVLVVLVSDPERRPAGGSAADTLVRAVTDWDGRAGGELSVRHREVAAAARRHVLAFLDVDHRDTGDRIDRVLEGATGEFARQVATSRDRLARTARRNRSVSTGTVVAVGVGDLDRDSAVVFVAADSRVRDDRTDGDTRTRRHRLRLDLVREDGRWKTSRLEFLG
jgi:Mce-associated membrane protein